MPQMRAAPQAPAAAQAPAGEEPQPASLPEVQPEPGVARSAEELAAWDAINTPPADEADPEPPGPAAPVEAQGFLAPDLTELPPGEEPGDSSAPVAPVDEPADGPGDSFQLRRAYEEPVIVQVLIALRDLLEDEADDPDEAALQLAALMGVQAQFSTQFPPAVTRVLMHLAEAARQLRADRDVEADAELARAEDAGEYPPSGG